ncbi:unnamed protein product [Paramecium octaurelia]|uniref:Uncharacterized protein n=1 Tax=Paramecium octaurelia TaxID=43137 RepID=A0A8S1TA04_PAROT|nr:unnamed protein product [Paramecium octaurelia]
MKVIIIFGCPGSGKTTLSKLLNTDIIIEADSLQQQHQFNPDDWKKSRVQVRQILEEYLQEKKFQTILIDDDFLLMSQRKQILHICQKFKASYIEILINLNLQDLLNRNSTRDIKKKLNDEIVELLFNKFESKSLQNTIIIDSKYNTFELLNQQVIDMDIKHQNEYLTEDQMINEKENQIKQNQENIVHQTDLELRKVISTLCKQTGKQGNYDPKYLSLKKKQFLQSHLTENVEENVFLFLQTL